MIMKTQFQTIPKALIGHKCNLFIHYAVINDKWIEQVSLQR